MEKLFVEQILRKATHYPWSIQGLGMLRLYLSKEVRLHLWDPTLAFPGASPIHTHPWDFTSKVVVGYVYNQIYVERDEEPNFHYQVLKCGVGGGLVSGESGTTSLRRLPLFSYQQGETYSERAEEIHESKPVRGTVTIVTRKFKADEDHARVFWRLGTSWGSAEPRPATPEEISVAAEYSLATWFWN
jgi:hypothetical protein